MLHRYQGIFVMMYRCINGHTSTLTGLVLQKLGKLQLHDTEATQPHYGHL